MSLIGTYRASSAGSGSTTSNRVFNMTGFQPSGMGSGNLLGVALFVYSGSKWIPAESWMFK